MALFDPLPPHDSPADATLLAAVLNEVDYGLALIDAHTRRLLYANAPARQALQDDGPAPCGLMVRAGLICTRPGVAPRPLEQALERARMRLRGLLSLDSGDGKVTLAFMPVQAPLPGGAAARLAGGMQGGCPVLLVFPKPQLCDATTITLFAREHGLSCVEGQVLAQLCHGARPNDIAQRHRVQVSTVRTQMRSIRQKTGAESIRDLVRQVAVLPPLMGVLRRALMQGSPTRERQLQGAFQTV